MVVKGLALEEESVLLIFRIQSSKYGKKNDPDSRESFVSALNSVDETQETVKKTKNTKEFMMNRTFEVVLLRSVKVLRKVV